MGFYGTLKMIFYKVSRISAGDYPPVSPLTHLPSRFYACSLPVVLLIFDAPLTADFAATAEVAERCNSPPETPL